MESRRLTVTDWYKAPSGTDCAWCSGWSFEPFDYDDAEQALCRGHLAEFEGTSLDGLDRQDADIRADMANLGYFD
jgi:hypothetical protein